MGKITLSLVPLYGPCLPTTDHEGCPETPGHVYVLLSFLPKGCTTLLAVQVSPKNIPGWSELPLEVSPPYWDPHP